MKSIYISAILIFIVLNSCSKKQNKDNITNLNTHSKMSNVNLANTIATIKTSETYENPKNWKARGLMPSDKPVILLLRTTTNEFLDKLEEICITNESSETKLRLVSQRVDELPWNELDTEEKEFLVDTLAPAIKAAGFNPSTLF